MPKLSEMRPGDLISDLDDEDHFMMWVGGNLSLVENVDADDFHGIFQHSDSKVQKRINGEDEGGKGFAVFRCEDDAIAKRAAEFAIEWATSTSDKSFKENMAKGEPFPLKVPFNQDRLVHEREQDYDDWDVRSLFRALRALAKHDDKIPVSRKGWTCSSFATYCYQAAALSVLFNDGKISPAVLEMVRKTGSREFLKIKNDLNIISAVLAEWVELVRTLLPKGLLVDGKAIDATNLKEFLEQTGNGFRKLGNITAG